MKKTHLFLGLALLLSIFMMGCGKVGEICLDPDKQNYNSTSVASDQRGNSYSDQCYQGGQAADSCSGDGCILKEAVCNDGTATTEDYNCPNGCSNGACLP